MSLRNVLQTQFGQVADAIMRQTLGVVMEYFHEQNEQSQDWIEVVAYPVSPNVQTNNQFGNWRTNVQRMVLQVPAISNATGTFPPEGGITNGDLIRFKDEQDIEYRIESSKADDLDIMFELSCVRVKHKASLPQES